MRNSGPLSDDKWLQLPKWGKCHIGKCNRCSKWVKAKQTNNKNPTKLHMKGLFKNIPQQGLERWLSSKHIRLQQRTWVQVSAPMSGSWHRLQLWYPLLVFSGICMHLHRLTHKHIIKNRIKPKPIYPQIRLETDLRKCIWTFNKPWRRSKFSTWVYQILT